MAGWEIKVRRSGAFVLVRYDADTGEEEVTLVDPDATVDELREYALTNAEVGDWIIGPEGHEEFAVMIVGVAKGDSERD